MQITYDPRSDAMYLQLAPDAAMKSLRNKRIENVVFDLNVKGEVVGIEILDIRRSGFDPNVQVIFSGQAEAPRP